MIPRRLAIALPFSRLLAAGDFDRLAARWRSRITVVRNGRPLYTRLRITFSASAGFAIEEFATGGALAWLYKGVARINADRELFLEVASVTDANGATPEPGRARYQSGETYNLGVVEFLSSARVRVGALELQKELD
ncbi:MAG: hypothetical protein JNM66_22055 [Bryobacterales bacterium]|nr:hypothetical protein [Bryobacterales bacterium]